MRIDEAINNLRTKAEGIGAGVSAAWDAFKGSTGMIPKEEQTIGNLKYAIRMNQEEMEPNEINFVDFNGMVLSMTIEEVMQLTEMPKPNEYYNLTFEKWSETLEEIQDGRCHTVGAFYHTTDGCNYYVVEVKAGDTVKLEPRTVDSHVYWGDGTDEQSKYSNAHTYEKAGKYAIKLENPPSNIIGFVEAGDDIGIIPFLTEVYLSDKLDSFRETTFRYSTKLRKISFSNKINGGYIAHYSFNADIPLKSLILPDKVAVGNVGYSKSVFYLEYIVANGEGSFAFPSCTDLKCCSFKNVTTSEIRNGFQIMPRLKNIVFDKIETIVSGVFSRGTDYRDPFNGGGIIDLPETLQSIGNNSLRTCPAHVYLRTLTPPTLGGTNVFWWNDYGKGVTIHIRKDATYTDAAGTTYTGLEAYAKATNWATLYANSTYTFIDDL